MKRPKTIKKPSQKSLRRAIRRVRRRERWVFGSNRYIMNDFVAVGGTAVTGSSATASITNGGANSVVTWTENAAAGSTGHDFFRPVPVTPIAIRSSQIVIESLDEGRTWHTGNGLDPAMNRDGVLVIRDTINGAAPEFMRPGSGTYRFEITMRSATDEERAQWWADHEARAVSYEFEARQRAERRKAATERAKTLLRSHLNKNARADFETKGGFWVISQFGNRYWVTKNTAVRFDDRGIALQRYCIHAIDYDIPPEDNALMRKLVLECNEDLFLKTANPGSPTEWDLGQPPVQFATNPQFINARTMQINGASGNGGNVRVVPAGPGSIALFWVNGILRPLTG